MRTVVACFVLAAAIATPGIVVAATSSKGATAQVFGLTSGSVAVTAAGASGPINPALRPTVDAVKAAFAAKGIELAVEPLGGKAAEAFAFDPSSRCPTVIDFELGSESSHLLNRGCSSGGSIQATGGVMISYTPGSIGPTIEQALATLPG